MSLTLYDYSQAHLHFFSEMLSIKGETDFRFTRDSPQLLDLNASVLLQIQTCQLER